MRQRIALALLLSLTIMPGCAKDSAIDRQHTEWIVSVLRSAQTIKPGMTREQLLRVFKTEGGASTRLIRTYVYQQCPYIKVNVEFIAVGNAGDRLTEMPEDKILKISQPYLDYVVVD